MGSTHNPKIKFDFFARFVVIWTLITRIPMPKSCWPRTVPAGNRALSIVPLAGGVLGFLVGAVITAVNMLGIGQAASIWIGSAFYVLAGWALHLDGWGDLWDGIGSGREGDELRFVMKDSRLGAYGAVGLMLALGLWTSLQISAAPVQKTVICMVAAASGRFAMCVAAFFGYYPWESGMGKGWVDTFSGNDLAISMFCTLIFMPFAPAEWFFSILLASLTGYLFARWMNKKLGGVNGDVLGAAAVAAELLSLVVFSL